MEKAESLNNEYLNVDYMRSLVKQYSELGQWTSALFWADAAAAAGSGSASGDDVWLLASAMLARGEFHRAAHTVTSRGLHRRHLLCLGVAMRAYIAARDPAAALSALDECDPLLLEQKSTDQTHNRALAGVLVWQARALSTLERREAAAEALAAALRADCACYEALDLLLEQHMLTPKQEIELVESLPINTQLSAAEGALLRSAYRERVQRYVPAPRVPPPPDTDCPITLAAEAVRARTLTAACARARRLCAGGLWKEALHVLDTANGTKWGGSGGWGAWCCAAARAACLVELRRGAELFAFAHTLVDAYPDHWTSWYAVGCYYYLIGKNEFARRYLSKAKSLEPGVGCVWLVYGHSFAADNEHDQAMAAYFKSSQLMAGCYLPSLYVGVECSLLNNVSSCKKFLLRAALLHNNTECGAEAEACGDDDEGGCDWFRLVRVVCEPHVAHEAGAAALAVGDPMAARTLWLRALAVAAPVHVDAVLRPDDCHPELDIRWAATLDALGHAYRKLGMAAEALGWHEKALSLRPAHAPTYAALGLCLALLGREAEATDALHSALAKDPDDSVSLSLLNTVIDRIDSPYTNEAILTLPCPDPKTMPPPAPLAPHASPAPAADLTDQTNTSDMSMSFD